MIAERTDPEPPEIRILLVEDEPTDAELVARRLRDTPLRVSLRLVTNEEAFLRELAGFSPDLVLSDYKLPRFDGLAALKLAQVEAPGTPVIIVTGSINEETAVECMKAGAADYVLKGNLTRLGPAVLGALEKRRLRELQESSERKLRKTALGLLQAQRIARLGHWEWDLETERVHLSEEACRILGLTRPELDGAREALLARVHPEDLPALVETMRECAQGGRPCAMDLRIVRPDGAVRTVSLQAEVAGGTGSRTAVGTLLDITERVEVQATLLLQKSKLEEQAHLLDLAHALVRDMEDRVIAWHRGAEELYGWSAAEAMGRVTHQLFRTEFPRPIEEIRRHLLRKGDWQGELVHTAKDGRRVVVASHWSLHCDPAGRAVSVLEVNNDITRSRDAEEALWEAERRFRRLTQGAPVGIFQTDARGDCLFVNRMWCRIAGLTPKQAMGRGWTRALHPEDRERVFAEWYRGAASNRPFASEYRFRTPQGRVAWLSGAAVALHGPDGEINGFIGTITDITRLKAAEEERRQSESLLRLTADGVRALVSYVDRERRYRFANRSYEEWFGIPRSELLGRRMWEVLGNAAYQQISPQVDRVLAGDSVAYEALLPYRSGGPRYVSVTYEPHRDAEGAVLGFVVSVNDLTDRKRMEDDLRSSEERYRLLFEGNPFPTWVVDAEAHAFLKVNQAAVDHYGFSREEFLGMDLSRIRHPDDAPALEEHLRQPPAASSRGTWRHRKRDGTVIWVEVSFHAMTFQGRKAVLEVINDVTERRRLEGDLRRKVRELAEADRSKDQFLAMLAHELRNPLAPIRSAVQVIALQGPRDPGARWASEVVGRQVKHLARLVDDLLDVSRITRGKIAIAREPLEVAAVVEAAVEASQPLIEERRHVLEVSLPRDPLLVHGDITRLGQVLSNLLNNAAKYMDPGGRIRVSAQSEAGQAVLRVRDTGMGIPPEALPHVFELFRQGDRSLDRAQGGLGVGLTLARRLVELHEGRIEAFSEGPGKGSEFTVRLPLLPEVAGRKVDEREERRDRAPSSPCRILVVDDNQDAASTLSQLLQALGHSVDTAHDGPEALVAFGRHRPDLVFLDIGLPGMHGYDVARRLRELDDGKKTVLIALTGYGQEDDRRKSREAGFDGHLVKPVDFASLERWIEKAARKG